MNLNRIFQECLSDIDGKNNRDVKWYLYERPKQISRGSFFETATYAIWVAGLSREGVNTFLKRAEQNGFSWDFADIGLWNRQDLQEFMVKLHGLPVPPRAAGKWKAVHVIAEKLITYSTEKDFRRAFFQGKSKSADLDDTDVQKLTNLKLSYIGEATAQFIVREMGGETIKYDRWIKKFIDHYKMSSDELEKQLKELSIPLGLFDIVIWAYCEKFVGKTKKFSQHFEAKFN